MAIGHVGADYQKHVGVVEVLIRARRTIRSQRQLVARARTRHAEPRVGFDLVGADEPFGQLVGQVLGLDRHLS